MKRRHLWMLVLIAGCGFVLSAAAPPPGTAGTAAGLTSKPWLYEIVRHLYRWYFDERDVDGVMKTGEVIFWVREIKPKLDEGDRSRFGEVVLPQFSMIVKVKQADYTIPELDVTVKNAAFRITSVVRADAPVERPEGATEVRANYTELRDELFKTRNLAPFAEGELLERLRAALRAEVHKDGGSDKKAAPTEKQVVFLAPLSPIANEAWVYWETGRTLIRFASDIDLTNPAVWKHEKLAVRLFQLDQKVVVSLDEVSGSNAFMTRDEAGRALFNCMVLGKRVELQPPASANSATGER